MRRAVVCRGDVRFRLKKLPNNFFQATLMDPPYGLEDMEQAFGWAEIPPTVDEFRELLRVTVPGGYLLCFSHVTTLGFTWMAIYDAGWKIINLPVWVFNKRPIFHQYVDRAIDRELQKPVWRPGEDAIRLAPLSAAAAKAQRFEGYANKLRVMHDPIILAMKPVAGSYAKNALTHGVAGLNIGACRLPANDKSAFPVGCRPDSLYGGSAQTPDAHPESRYPGNVLLDQDVANRLDQIAGEPVSRFVPVLNEPFAWVQHLDKEERRAGLSRPTEHPCLKPLKLTEWLARLILPPTQPKRLLVPYSGAGSEMIGGVLAGWEYVYGIEMNQVYVRESVGRMRYWLAGQPGKEELSIVVT